jgi:hypothetical protein
LARRFIISAFPSRFWFQPHVEAAIVFGNEFDREESSL